MKCRYILIMLMALTYPTLTLAHPGHGPEEGAHTTLHYFTTAEHFVPLLLGMTFLTAGLRVAWLRRVSK